MMKTPIIYLTRDKERALGMPEDETYFIISEDGQKDTYELLSDSSVQEKIKKLVDEKNACLLVFKNTLQIENLAKEKGWKLLNPSAVLSEKIENKISQVEWLRELAGLLPSHEIVPAKDIAWENKSFILQWAHGHTGDGTLLIENEKQLGKIKEKFPERQARVMEYIRGPVFTLNIVIGENLPENVALGNISYQITGLAPFTDNPFSTIGNDWAMPHKILSESEIKEIIKIARLVGKRLYDSGWKGLAGLDIIYDEKRKKVFLIEINARQPASVTYESELQKKIGGSGMTIFQAHLLALTDRALSSPIIEIKDGAQIVQRITKSTASIENIDKIEKMGYKVIMYKNDKINSDLLRIQSVKSLLEGHNKFNKNGRDIVKLLT